MDAQDAKIHGPDSLTTVVEIETGGDRKRVDGSEQEHKLMGNVAKADRKHMSVVATTINEESCVAAAIPEELCRMLDAIALRRAKSPHSVIIPGASLWEDLGVSPCLRISSV